MVRLVRKRQRGKGGEILIINGADFGINQGRDSRRASSRTNKKREMRVEEEKEKTREDGRSPRSIDNGQINPARLNKRKPTPANRFSLRRRIPAADHSGFLLHLHVLLLPLFNIHTRRTVVTIRHEFCFNKDVKARNDEFADQLDVIAMN